MRNAVNGICFNDDKLFAQIDALLDNIPGSLIVRNHRMYNFYRYGKTHKTLRRVDKTFEPHWRDSKREDRFGQWKSVFGL
jgi:hypothetical protein